MPRVRARAAVLAAVASSLVSRPAFGAGDPLCPRPEAGAGVDVEAALKAAALGLERLSRGEIAAAVRCLELARKGLPRSEVIARDLGVALAQAGRLGEARLQLEAAARLGDPGGHLERALVAAELGDEEAALSEARAAGGVEGDTVAAALEHPAAVRELGQRLLDAGEEETPLVRLVLASLAAEEGALGAAQAIVSEAELGAEAASDPLTFNVARGLRQRLAASTPVKGALRLRIAGEQVSNPSLLPDGVRGTREGYGVRGAVEGALAIRLGPVTWNLAAFADQRLFLADREALAEAERSALVGATSLVFPFSEDLRAAALEVGLRVIDVRADGFSAYVGTGLESGATLRISLAARWWGELGVSGVWTDVAEPADRSLDRDRVGQRARLALLYDRDDLVGALEVVALNDETEGLAFDAIGIGVGGWVELFALDGLRLRTGTSIAVRTWGPFGDEAVIGETARRQDLRFSAMLGARWRLAPGLDWVIEDVFVRTDAREGRGYSSNLLSMGVEVTF